MGLKSWYAAQSARHQEAKSGAGGFYGKYRLTQGELVWDFGRTRRPLAGATAEFESGAASKSPTLGRVAAGAILAGPAGAIVGGLFQKDRSRVYVTVRFATGEAVVIDGPVRDESALRGFAAKINAAAASASQ